MLFRSRVTAHDFAYKTAVSTVTGVTGARRGVSRLPADFPVFALRPMISLTKLQFPSLRALPVPVVEFHGFPADFTFSLTGAQVSPRKLLFPPNPPCRVPFGNFSRHWADFAPVPRFRDLTHVFSHNT